MVSSINQMPLGAAALAGTTYPIEREFTAQRIRFLKGFVKIRWMRYPTVILPFNLPVLLAC